MHGLSRCEYIQVLQLVTQVSPFNYRKKSWPRALWNVSGLRRELSMEFFLTVCGRSHFSENVNDSLERKEKKVHAFRGGPLTSATCLNIFNSG